MENEQLEIQVISIHAGALWDGLVWQIPPDCFSDRRFAVEFQIPAYFVSSGNPAACVCVFSHDVKKYL